MMRKQLNQNLGNQKEKQNFNRETEPGRKQMPGSKETSGFPCFLGSSNSSDLTIYHNAIQDGRTKKGLNSSSEEESMEMDTSDESNEIIIANENGMSTTLNQIDDFIADCCRRSNSRFGEEKDPQPCTSRQVDSGVHGQQNIPLTAENRANQITQQAEGAKVRIFQAPGENFQAFANSTNHVRYDLKLSNEMVHSVMVDENYLMIRTHLDENIKRKIIKGEYVEFERLLQRDQIQQEEDQHMQIVNRGNQMFWVPVRKNSMQISNFGRWKLAFKVFTMYMSKRIQVGPLN